jgi:hypothetical protein
VNISGIGLNIVNSVGIYYIVPDKEPQRHQLKHESCADLEAGRKHPIETFGRQHDNTNPFQKGYIGNLCLQKSAYLSQNH